MNPLFCTSCVSLGKEISFRVKADLIGLETSPIGATEQLWSDWNQTLVRSG